MNKQQEENTNLTVELNDLALNGGEEIKGGQTREHILLAKQNLPGATRASGDFDHDGDVDGRDFLVWR